MDGNPQPATEDAPAFSRRIPRSISLYVARPVFERGVLSQTAPLIHSNAISLRHLSTRFLRYRRHLPCRAGANARYAQWPCDD